MNSKKFFGRLLPFFATFLVGIFVASFFVTIGRPNFGARGWERHRECQRMRLEYDRLTEENMRLKSALESRHSSASDWDATEIQNLAVPPPPLTPVKPATPRAIR